MAAILRSSLWRAVRRAASSGPLHQLPPPRRLLRAGRPNLAPQEPAEVEQLAKKTEEVAKKEVLFKYVESLVEEQKEYGSPNLEGAGIPWFQAVAFIASFMAGYSVGLDEATESGFQKLGRKRLD